MSQAHARGGELQVGTSEGGAAVARQWGRLILREPFQRRTWSELAFFLTSSALAWAAAFLLAVVGAAGLALTFVFVGVLVIAGGLRAARGLGRWQRALAGFISMRRSQTPSRSRLVPDSSAGSGRR